MDGPSVSVIIPTYNRAHCLMDAISSVLAQSFQDFELIVVDDGSTDGTSEMLEIYRDRLKLIRQKNGGAGSARNAGIKAAQGEWVAFLDSDDTWEVDKLKVQVEDLRAIPNGVAHMVDAVIVDSAEGHVSLFELRGMHAEYCDRPFRVRPLCDVVVTQFFTSCWMLKRKVIEKAGYFDPMLRIFEDFDLLTRVALEGPFVVNCYPGTYMRRRPGGSDALSILYQRARLQSLYNLVHTFSRLKQDSRLTASERKVVDRSLSGVWCEVATEYKQERDLNKALIAIFRSMTEDFGLRSLARALLTVTGTKNAFNILLPRHQRGGHLRRSERDESGPG